MSNGTPPLSLDEIFASFDAAQIELQKSAAKHGIRTREVARQARSKSGEHAMPRVFTPGTLPAVVVNDPDQTARLHPLKK